MMEDLISVIIPTYGRDAFLREAVDSVIAQTYHRTEIIVVEDGSRVAEDALKPFGSEIRYIWQSNHGVAAARNAGAAAAKGKWLAFLDDDDLWMPEKLEKQIALSRCVPDAGLIHTGHLILDHGQLRAVDDGSRREPIPSGWVTLDLFNGNFIVNSSTLVDSAVFQRSGGFDPRYRISQDLDLWLRISLLAPICHVAEPLTIYRWHGAALTDKFQVEQSLERVHILSKIAASPEFRGLHGNRQMITKRLRDVKLDCARRHFWADLFGEAKGQFFDAWKLRPWEMTPLVYALICAMGVAPIRILRRLKIGLTANPG